MKMFDKDFNESVLPCMDWRMHIVQKWLQQLPWRHKFLKGIGGNEDISKRTISVKELGQVACQGWLYRKKSGMGFLGSKWKKSWFVLKNTTLYWYTSQKAEKAEGYIHLTDFTIEQATEGQKKYTIKASHGQPPMMILFFAAMDVKDLNRWLAKLFTVAKQNQSKKTCDAECGMEANEDESMLTTSPLYSEQLTRDSVNGEIPPPSFTSSPFNAMMAATTPTSVRSRESSESQSPRLSGSWLDGPSPEGQWRATGPPQLWHSGEEDGVAVQDRSPDEMEPVFFNPKRSRPSPCYLSTTDQVKATRQTDFGTSFVRGCNIESIYEKLHLVRTLRSTFKVLADPRITVLKDRQWKRSNVVLLQEITCCKSPAGGSRVLPFRAPREPCIAETSL